MLGKRYDEIKRKSKEQQEQKVKKVKRRYLDCCRRKASAEGISGIGRVEGEGKTNKSAHSPPSLRTSPSINLHQGPTMSTTDDQMRVDPARTKALIAALHSVAGRINNVAQGREVSESDFHVT